jgi:hypothetical protein
MPQYLEFDSPLSPHILAHVNDLDVRLGACITLYEIMASALTLFSSLGSGIERLELVYIARTPVVVEEETSENLHHGYSIIETVFLLFCLTLRVCFSIVS